MRHLLLMFAACGGATMPSGGAPDASSPSSDASSPSDAPIVAAACSGKQAQPLDATWMIGDRPVQVHVPASYDPSVPMPVVLDLHGLTMDAASEAALTSANAAGDAHGFISIHPQGATTPGSWNAGACCGTAPSLNIDDMGYLTSVLDVADAKLCVDDHRVYAMGMSNGAYMSHRLACEMADRIAAIGPVSGGIAVTCEPSRPVPVFEIHGNADPIVAYDLGKQSADWWQKHNGCTTMSTTYSHGTASCVTYAGCSAGADVTWCTIAGGGHQWPGGETLPLLGNNTDDLDATNAIWSFFAAHPKP